MATLMRTPLVAGVLAASTFLLVACGTSSSSGGTAANTSPIVIGGGVSSTGAYASSGANVLAGYQTAVDQINATGGVLGRKLKLSVQDDTSDPATLVRIYTQLLTVDKVDALVSPYGSALSKPAAELADRYKTPLVHSLTSSPAVFSGTKYSVGAGLPPGPTLLAALPAFVKQKGYQKIALVANDLEAFGLICQGVHDAAVKAGLTIYSDHYASTTADFSSVALRTKQTSPDVVVMCGAIQDSVGLARALSQQAFKPKVLVSDISQQPTFQTSLGPLANKVVGYTTWSSTFSTTGNTDFVKAYSTAHNGTPPNDIVANAYASVSVLAAAIKKAGSTDHAKVNEALHQMTLETVMGNYKVDSNGVQIGYKPSLTQFLDGKLQVIYPDKVATATAQLPY
jgi:branched-chain amino acid transport system substrate-binding protein